MHFKSEEGLHATIQALMSSEKYHPHYGNRIYSITSMSARGTPIPMYLLTGRRHQYYIFFIADPMMSRISPNCPANELLYDSLAELNERYPKIPTEVAEVMMKAISHGIAPIEFMEYLSWSMNGGIGKPLVDSEAFDKLKTIVDTLVDL